MQIKISLHPYKISILSKLTVCLLIFSLQISNAQSSGSASDWEVLKNMKGLLSKSPSIQKKSARWLTALNDISVVPAFIDAMRFISFPKEWGKDLKKVTGQKFGEDWPDWMEWLGQQDFTPHPAYQAYKAHLYRILDPEIGNYFATKNRFLIRLDEVVWGGVKKDGIPALDNPEMIAAEDAGYLSDSDAVFGLSVNGEHHAYPLRILNWHEMLNIEIGGAAISLSYCTLCGAAVPYLGKVDSVTYTFGSSGLLYRSNKLMYDRQTNSLWSSLTGKPISGELVDQSIQLKIHPVVRTSWREWRKQHPDTRVLSIETGFPRDYSAGAAYQSYFDSDKTMFPIALRDPRMATKDWVYGIHLNGSAKAWALSKLKNTPLVNDTFSGKNLIILADAENLTVRVYERGDVTFTEMLPNQQILDENGQTWQLTETGIETINGTKKFSRLPGHLAYWFAWYAFFPKTLVW